MPEAIAPEPQSYRVHLDAYAGPLDLLLHLVKQHEIDLHDIPIAKLTEQYLAHLDAAALRTSDGKGDGPIDVDRAGEFLVMAATLVEIKSATLMPRIENEENAALDEAEADAGDPRFELVQQLLAYKKFKDAAHDLEARRDAWSARFPAAAKPAKTPAPAAGETSEDEAAASSPAVELDLEDLGVNDLCDAFARLLDSIGFVGDHQVTYDETPISLHAEDIADRLARDGRPVAANGRGGGMTLRELFVGRQSRSEMVGLFLATLELVRQRRVRVAQDEVGADIRLVLRDEADRDDLNDDAASTAPPVPTGIVEDLALMDRFDWPDAETRRRVERRLKLRAAHREPDDEPAPRDEEGEGEASAEPPTDQGADPPGA